MQTIVLYIISVTYLAGFVILFRQNMKRSKNSQVQGELLVKLSKEVDNIKELLRVQVELNRVFVKNNSAGNLNTDKENG